MAPSRRKGVSKAAAAAAARRQWKVGDLVLAKVKGFPAWPATVSEPEKWGYSSDWKKVLVYFFGTNQIAFCNPVDVEAFTEEKKQLFLSKRHGRSADFLRAVQEIVDSYEKQKELNETDANRSSAPDENPPAPCSDIPDSVVSGATLHSKLKSSNSDTVMRQRSCCVEDAEASTEVNAHNQEECEAISDDLPGAKNSHSIRKKSRSPQLQCPSEHEKLSVKRCRSTSRRCKKAVGGSKGSFDSSERRRKLKRKSPDKFIRNAGDSTVCNSNGTVDDNDSEVAMADSDNLSNNEVGAIESNHKSQVSETLAELCETDAGHREQLNLPTETVILRKKRKPARKRVIIDVVECIAQSGISENGAFCNAENGPSTYENDETHPKDGGDEHLPLVKRARVRMGKQLSKEEQLALVQSIDEKVASEPVGPSSDSIAKDDGEDSLAAKTSDIENCEYSYAVKISDSHVFEKSLATKTSSEVLPPFDTSTQVSHGDATLGDVGNADKSHLLSHSVNGEAALPPSKRLHRALEAMSANTAKEVQSFAELSSASRIDSKLCPITSPESLHNNLDRHGESKSEGNNELSWSNGFSTISNLPRRITPSCEAASMENKSAVSSGLKEQQVALCSCPGNQSDGIDRNLAIDDVGSQALSVDQLPVEDSMKVMHDEPQADKTVDRVKLETSVCIDEVPDSKSEDNIPARSCIPSTPSGPSKNTKPLMDEVEQCGTVICLNQLSTEKSLPISRCEGAEELKTPEPDVTCGSSPAEEVDIPSLVPPLDSSFPGAAGCNTSHRNEYTPHTNLDYEQHASDKHKRLDVEVSCRGKSLGKLNNPLDVKSTLSSFEMTLATLTRTKESIGRATRIALDCAKLGVAAEVVDIIARNLERESSLYRRVDLFFLVDSVAQCCRGVKGGIGDKCISAIQATLPRFLSATAPPGYAGRENRRQCMKVLKLWLERRVISASIISQQLRRLDSLSGSSSTDRPSQRMTRTDRAFDDPIREMEGMLVDEYGSNSSFQLPGFCMPRMLNDDDGASDSDDDGGSFEAVTPEHELTYPDNQEASSLPAKEKHRHILEDVDGELEMEDVAPSENETRPTATTSRINDAYPHEQQYLPCFGPPPSHDVPSQAPPLPMSPPPAPPPPPASSDITCMPSVSDSVAESCFRNGSQNVPEAMRSRSPVTTSSAPQITDNSSSSCSFSSYSIGRLGVRPRHNTHQTDTCVNGYLRPPHPSASNQFVYFDQVRWPGDAAPQYCNRPQFGPAMEGGHFYGDHDIAGTTSYDESWRYSRPTFPAPLQYEKDTKYQPPPYMGPPHEYARTNHDWPYPALSMHHHNHAPNAQFSEPSVPIAVRAPGYWPPR